MAELTEQINETVRQLSGSLSMRDLNSNIPIDLIISASSKRLRSALLKNLLAYKEKCNYGHLATCVMLSLILNGSIFISKIESKGVLLCFDHCNSRFKKMLSRLYDASGQLSTGDCVKNRLQTYINFYNYSQLVQHKIDRLKYLLINRSNTLVKALLGITEISFIERSTNSNLISGNLRLEYLVRKSGSPEELASLVSQLVWKANDLKPLTRGEFQGGIESKLNSEELIETIECGYAYKSINEISKAISCFGYTLEIVNDNKLVKKFIIRPPSQDFEQYLRLGYIRNELIIPAQRMNALDRFRNQFISMDTAVEYILKNDGNLFTEWKEHPFPRIIVKYPSFITKLIDRTMFDEDVLHTEIIRNEYLISDSGDNIYLNDKLNLNEFMNIRRHLAFFSKMNSKAIYLHYEKYRRKSINSAVRVTVENEFVESMSEILNIEGDKFRSFIELVLWDASKGSYFDVQYMPFIRVEEDVIFLPAIFGLSNIFRNVQVSKKMRIQNRGEIFTEICKDLLTNQKFITISEKRIKKEEELTEIDIIAIMGKSLYLIECKYSIQPCNFQEMRDIWDEVIKGVTQLHIARKILEDPHKKRSYLSGWFPGMKKNDIDDLEIKTCIITSHRLFSGMEFRGVPIRDFYSYHALMTEHAMSFGVLSPGEEATLVRYSIVDNGRFSKDDLDDYLDPKSRYFKMFSEHMRPVTRYEYLVPEQLIIAWETFLYAHDGDDLASDYIERMDRLGFYRLADAKKYIEPLYFAPDHEPH